MKKWKGKRTVRENLRARMPKLVDDYFRAGQAAFVPGTPWEEVHRFRLLTKRFRYTLEIFRQAYGPGIDHRIEALREVQTLLGDINDCVVTAGLLETVPGTESVRTALKEKADKKADRLHTLWQQRFEAAGQRESWIRYLTQYACRPGRISRTKRGSAPDPATVEKTSQVT